MVGGKKFWACVTSLLFLLAITMPAFAGEREVDVNDLKGISPHHFRYLFSVAGGAAIGAGVGALLGSGNDIVKGIMMGGGGASAAYLHTHRSAQLKGWRDWALIGSYTSLASGAGWTLCGCKDGAVAGALIGGGAAAIWRASTPSGNTTTAQAMGH